MQIHLIDDAAKIPKSGLIGLDIETSPKRRFLKDGRKNVPPDPRLHRVVLAQVCVDDDVFVLRDNFRSLAKLLENDRVIKVIHNSSFEYKHFLVSFDVRIKNIFDTLLFEGVYDSGHRPDLSLDGLTQKHLNLKLKKDVRDRFINGDAVTDEMVRYGALDAWVLPKIYQKMQELPDNGYQNFPRVLDLEHRLVPALANIESLGFSLNTERWLALAEKKEEELAQVRKEILRDLPTTTKRITIFGDSLSDENPNSQTIILDGLHKLGIDLPDLKQETVADSLEKYDHPLLRRFARYKVLQKLTTTYGRAFLKEHVNPITGRVHQRIRQVETRTGRFAGDKPNLMNIPNKSKEYQEYRACFWSGADDDLVLLARDYSQQELRILAELSGDPGMIEAFERGIDIHVHVARKLYKDDTIDKDDPRRKPAKNINFGLIYRMGVKKLAKSLKISVREAKELSTEHARTFPRVTEYMNDIAEFATQHGYVETLIGRRRYLDMQLEESSRQAGNTPIQGSAAEMTKIATIRINKHPDLGQIVNIVHDEIIMQTTRDRVDACNAMLEKAMLDSAQMLVKKVPFATDGYTSRYWSKDGARVL